MKDVDIVFGNEKYVSKALHSTQFALKDVGKTSYYRSSYENNTGKRGPASRILTIMIW